MKSLCLLTTKIWKATKNAKIGVVWEVRGHPRSSETSPFNRSHMTSYSTLTETMRLRSILYRFRVIARFSLKVANFYPPHLHLPPPKGWSHSNFAVNFAVRKLDSRGYRVHGVICVILRLAVLIQYWSVTDRHRDTHTWTHDDGIY